MVVARTGILQLLGGWGLMAGGRGLGVGNAKRWEGWGVVARRGGLAAGWEGARGWGLGLGLPAKNNKMSRSHGAQGWVPC